MIYLLSIFIAITMLKPVVPMQFLKERQQVFEWLFNLRFYVGTTQLREALANEQPDRDANQKFTMETITFFVDKSLRYLIVDCTTPKEMLLKLVRHFFPKTLHARAQIRADIANTKHNGIGSTLEFSDKIILHFKELRLNGEILNEDEIMTTILYKLHKDFAPFIDQLNECRSLAQFHAKLMDIDDKLVIKRALKEELRVNREIAEYNRRFGIQTVNRNAHRHRYKNLSCYRCGHVGHKQVDCPQPIAA